MLGPTPEPGRQGHSPPECLGGMPARDREGPILIVSRARRMLARLKKPLEGEGYRVCRAEGAEDALAFCAMLPGRLRLIIVDWLDPEVDAERLLAALHRVAPKLPLLLMEGQWLSESGVSSLRDPQLAGLLRDLALD